jgi:predicted RNase H-like HicB family nuclease
MAMQRNALIFTGLVVGEGSRFYSLCPELDVASQGRSVAEAKVMLREAVTGYLESCFESNLPFLRPVAERNDPRCAEPENVVSAFRLKVDLSIKVHAA